MSRDYSNYPKKLPLIELSWRWFLSEGGNIASCLAGEKLSTSKVTACPDQFIQSGYAKRNTKL
jgi:hypothetical protein